MEGWGCGSQNGPLSGEYGSNQYFVQWLVLYDTWKYDTENHTEKQE